MSSPFRSFQLPQRLQEKYSAPIQDASCYDNCAPWLKQGAKLSFHYTNDNDRLNNCNTPQARYNDVHNTQCQNRGMYTNYRGRCTGYDAYFQEYNPVNGV